MLVLYGRMFQAIAANNDAVAAPISPSDAPTSPARPPEACPEPSDDGGSPLTSDIDGCLLVALRRGSRFLPLPVGASCHPAPDSATTGNGDAIANAPS